MFHFPAIVLAHPVLFGLGAVGLGTAGYEVYSHYSPHHAPATDTVQSGQSYVATMNMLEGPPPTLVDAHDAFRRLGFHPFSLRQDPKDPRSFSGVVGYHGHWFRHHAKLPTVARFRTRLGHRHVVSFPTNPVPYVAAVKTPNGAAAALHAPISRSALTPAAMSATAGFWRQGRGRRDDYGQREFRNPWKRLPLEDSDRPAPPMGGGYRPAPPTGY